MIEKHFKVSFKAHMKIEEDEERIRSGMLKYDLSEAIEESTLEYNLLKGEWKIEEDDGIDHKEAIVKYLEGVVNRLADGDTTSKSLALGFRHIVNAVKDGTYLQ